MRIGIYGGTFDPPHKGHIYIAIEAKKQLDLDEVWMVVSGNPPHKDDDKVTGRLVRFEMCRLALRGTDGIILKDFEMNNSSNCYSYELLTDIKEAYPDDEFFFIMGEDSLDLFCQWRKPEVIASLASLAVAVRSEDKESSLQTVAYKIEDMFDTRVYLLQTKNVPVSSSLIRESRLHGKSISGYVRKEVEEYIIRHRMYEATEAFDMDEISDKLRHSLKKSRYNHSIGVMDTAMALAMRYNYPLSLAGIAGLLHDCAKKYDNEKLLSLCERYNLGVSEAEKSSPHLLHAKVGAYIAEHKYGVSDKEVLHSIYTHTTGEPDMSLLGQIIFVADYIEPHRDKAVRLDEIRQVAFYDLTLAVLMILEDTISYLKKSNAAMDEKTIETYEYYKSLLRRKEL